MSDNTSKSDCGTAPDRLRLIEQRLMSIEINQICPPSGGAIGKMVFSVDPEARYCARCRRELDGSEVAFIVGAELLCEPCIKEMHKSIVGREKRLAKLRKRAGE